MSRRSKDNLTAGTASPARSGPRASKSAKAFHTESTPHNLWLSFAVSFLLALAVWAVFGQALRYASINYDDDTFVFENPGITQGLSMKGIVWAFTEIDVYTWYPLIALYIQHMLCPVGLAIGYGSPQNHLTAWRVGLSALILSIISASAWAGRKRCPYLLMGWLWYLGMMVPVIDTQQASGQARADRYTYLPQIGLYILLVWGAVELCGSWRCRRAVLGSAATAILAGLLVGAYVQTGYWKDSISLWTRSLACTSENAFAHYNLGNALRDRGKLDEAIQHYEQALQINPDYVQAHNNLGIAFATQGKLDEAIQHFERLLQLKPDYAEVHNNLGLALATQGKLNEGVEHYKRALQLKPDFAEAHFDLGSALDVHGQLQEALQHFDRALQLKPDYAEAHNRLGIALATLGRLDEAIHHFERLLQLKPDYAEAHNNLGSVLAGQGKINEALQHYERAIQLKPGCADAHYNLGRRLCQKGQLGQALIHYQKALEIEPDNPAILASLARVLATSPALSVRNGVRAIALARRASELSGGADPAMTDTLAAAYAEAGRFLEAIATAQKALELAQRGGQQHLAEQIGSRLELYLAGAPCREGPAAVPEPNPK
jgi:protein O-mannosyl-transferase